LAPAAVRYVTSRDRGQGCPMTDIWEITQYVEAHPDDHEQRWRLAKRLYRADEHRLALEHLQILRREWTLKVNVSRYLGATLLRLNRHGEAIKELEGAIGTWPNEIALREQLARALEVSERRAEASEAWKKIQALKPDHPLAQDALARLAAAGEDGQPEPALADSTVLMLPRQACPSCGWQNPHGVEECWQCATALAPEETLAGETPAGEETVAPPWWRRVNWTALGGVGAAALILAGVFLTARHAPIARQHAAGLVTIRDVHGLLATGLVLARAVVGVVLMVAWPVGLWLGLGLVRTEAEVSAAEVTVWGVFLAGLAYVLSWAPIPWIACAVAVPGVAAFGIVCGAFQVKVRRAAVVWLVQGLLVLLVSGATFVVIEGPRPFQEFSAIRAYAARHDSVEAPGEFPLLSEVCERATMTLEWGSTGSGWLDEKAAQVEFRIEASAEAGPITVKLRRDSETIVYEDFEACPSRFVVHVQPGQAYQLILDVPAGADARVTVFGVLIPRVAP